MKLLTVIGARPQFIKAAAVSRKLTGKIEEVIVHTGQHYDANMSDIFFGELDIPVPSYHLNIGSGSHGEMTGKMLIAIEQVVLQEKPDALMVYGDTNSTLAGALAASKLLIPVIHVEAGLRSFNRTMPEEKNRILTDHISDFLFVPTLTGVENLRREGIEKGVHLCGDVMYDGILHYSGIAAEKSTILEVLGETAGNYCLCTIHRAENTDDPARLKAIFRALGNCGERIVLPLHPRTQKFIGEYEIGVSPNIRITNPLGYLDMIRLMSEAKKIITDSGGIQKEAFFLSKPCITLRDETEWVETVENGWNRICGANEHKILDAIANFRPSTPRNNYFGDGNASGKIIDELMRAFA